MERDGFGNKIAVAKVNYLGYFLPLKTGLLNRFNNKHSKIKIALYYLKLSAIKMLFASFKSGKTQQQHRHSIDPLRMLLTQIIHYI